MNAHSFQPILPNYAKREHDVVGDGGKQLLADAKQTSRFTKGDDPRVQHLVDKFKSGKKLTLDERAYLRRNAPGMIDHVERISSEREVVEQSMRFATSKADVQNVVLLALSQIAMHQSSEERAIRTMQLTDAQFTYMQTDEYKEKPNRFIDQRAKRISTPPMEKSLLHHKNMALNAYEHAKLLSRPWF